MNATEGLWDFSIRTYGSEGVSDVCLALQNERGADVNMLLYCCWVATIYGKFDDDLFDIALRFSRTWAQDVVQPLRGVRTKLKRDDCDETVRTECRMQLRENVKRIELESERLQQTTLEALVPSAAQRSQISDQLRYAAANLRRYCQSEAIEIADESMDQLSAILAAAFPTTKPDSACELLK